MVYSNRMNKDDFQRIKRSKKWQWLFLASGEWSQSPYHQGNVTLYYAPIRKRLGCIEAVGFPLELWLF